MDPAALWIRVHKANKSGTLRLRIHNTGAKDPDPLHFGMQDPRQTLIRNTVKSRIAEPY